MDGTCLVLMYVGVWLTVVKRIWLRVKNDKDRVDTSSSICSISRSAMVYVFGVVVGLCGWWRRWDEVLMGIFGVTDTEWYNCTVLTVVVSDFWIAWCRMVQNWCQCHGLYNCNGIDECGG